MPSDACAEFRTSAEEAGTEKTWDIEWAKDIDV
jgi:hypothetical protein